MTAPGRLTALPTKPIPGHHPTGQRGSPEHPMRIMTRRAAGLDPWAWDEVAQAEVAAFFDALAPEWHTRTSPERGTVVADALDRGLPPSAGADGTCVELGSGIGAYTPLLARRWARVVAADLSLEMLLRAPTEVGHRVRADGSRLPLAAGAASALVLVNCFLFPAEADRALAQDGVLVWVNSSGAETPIHLSAEEVVAALPGRWEGVHSGAGVGTWCVVWRGAT